MRQFFLVFALLCVSCSSVLNFGKTKLWISTVRYSATDDANGKTVIPFHVVLIYDEKNVAEFTKMSGDEFYKKILDRTASGLERDYQNSIQIFEFHARPGGKLEQTPLKDKRSEVILEGMVYAQYQGKTFQKPLLDSRGVEFEFNDKGIEQKPFDLG
jgi:hypothetical protein